MSGAALCRWWTLQAYSKAWPGTKRFAPVQERDSFPVAKKEKRTSDCGGTDEARHPDHTSKRVEVH